MTKKSKSSLNALASGLMLLVIAVLVGAISYKQVFLAGSIAGNIPRDALARSLEECARAFYAPLPGGATQSGAGVQGLLSLVWQNVSADMLNTRLQSQQIDEIKVLKIDDFFGKNAQARISGNMQLVSQVPVVGQVVSRQSYTLTLFKQDQNYSFAKLAVKGENESQAQEWACAKQF